VPYEDKFEDVLRRHLRFLQTGQKLEPAASLDTLGLDSMASVELLLDIEESFDIELPDEALTAETFATPQKLYEAVVAAGG
jgi:acyl carrier protein